MSDKKQPDEVSEKVRELKDEQGNFIATRETIKYCQQLNNKKGTFCVLCEQKLRAYPSHVKKHCCCTIHLKSQKGERSENLTTEDLLQSNCHVLKVIERNGKRHVRCLACHRSNDEAIGLNFFVIKSHLATTKHIGILDENNETVNEVPVASVHSNEDDQFMYRRLKYERKHMLAKLNSTNVQWADVHFHFGYMENKYFCKCCNIFLQAQSNSKLATHAHRRFHQNNVPDEFGRSQNKFEYDLVEALMAGEL